MSSSAQASDPSPSEASEALAAADAAARRIRSQRRWYIAGALVMAVTLAVFTIALASWPERLAEVIIPGLLVVGAVLAVLAWSGRAIPSGAAAAANRAISTGAVLMAAALLLIRFALPEGLSVWAVLTGVLVALPFVYLAWRVSRA